MALYSLRLRRAFSLLNSRRPFSSISAVPAPLSLSSTTVTAAKPALDLTQPHCNDHRLLHVPFQSRFFRSSTVSLSSRPRSSSYNRDNDDDKISPDAILFEGCDYNHWLITMDFPKDNKPTPEEMVETYVQTAAKVLGSVEEAKKKIYACSTTTYNGFQVEVSEEVSEKFRGLPGVVFILPDSYIDPVNKEYGGDKYINGTIIPRPPPVQYGRPGGRYGDRNRDFNRQNRPRGPYQQGNAAYDNQGSMHGDSRNFGAQQNPPPPQFSGPPRDFGAQQNPHPPHYSGAPRDFGAQQNPQPQQYSGPPREFGAQQNPLPPPQYSGPPRDFGVQQNPLPPPQYSGPPRAGERRDPMPVNNAPGGWDNYQRDRREPMPSYQANYNQGQRDFQPQDQRNYAPPQGGAYGQGAGGTYGQGVGGSQGQGVGGGYGQGVGGSYGQGAGGSYGQGVGGTYGQGAGGVQGQGAGGGYGQGVGGAHGQEMGSGYGQSDLGHGENLRFSQMEPRDNMQGQQRNYAVMGETETGQEEDMEGTWEERRALQQRIVQMYEEYIAGVGKSKPLLVYSRRPKVVVGGSSHGAVGGASGSREGPTDVALRERPAKSVARERITAQVKLLSKSSDDEGNSSGV